MVSTVFAPGVPQVEKEFHSNSSAISSFMVSVYVMGSALGPLCLTPITEVTGRLPITHMANVLFTIAAVVCSTSVNMPMLIVARFFMGVASSVPVTVGGGFVADLMPMEKRGTAMTVWTVGPLMGFVAGPIFGGYIVETVGWRWTVWIEVFLVSPQCCVSGHCPDSNILSGRCRGGRLPHLPARNLCPQASRTQGLATSESYWTSAQDRVRTGQIGGPIDVEFSHPACYLPLPIPHRSRCVPLQRRDIQLHVHPVHDIHRGFRGSLQL